jgi:hypothetical protein
MKHRFLHTVYLVILLLISQTALSCSSPTSNSAPGKDPVGIVQRVSDTVEHNQVRLSSLAPIYQNDSLRLYGGGEGRLAVGNLELRLFNDTQLKEIRSESAPGQPLGVRLYLEAGGFTGRLTESGGQAVFNTPGGATIRVFGTTFYLVFDPGSQTTTVGNFEGALEIESGGEVQPVQPGTFRQALEGQPPTPEQPIPFSQDEFEGLARELGSPVEVINQTPPVVVFTPEPIPVDGDPPELGEIRIEPEMILLGTECPGADGMAQVTVSIFDPSGVAGGSLQWALGEERGEAPLERLDDQTFTARVGPVRQPGEVQVTIFAWDTAGNQTPGQIIFIPAQFCVG